MTKKNKRKYFFDILKPIREPLMFELEKKIVEDVKNNRIKIVYGNPPEKKD